MERLLKLYPEPLVFFSFEGIDTDVKNGIEKKKYHGIPKWSDITKENYKEYIAKTGHSGIAVICGQISNLTVFDIDSKDYYDKLVLDHPDIKEHTTVQTRNGYHIWFLYDATIKTSTNDAIDCEYAIDIRNDKSFITSPPTRYQTYEGNVIDYIFIKRTELKPIPDYMISKLKQKLPKKVVPINTPNKEGKKKEKKENTEQIEESDIDKKKKIIKNLILCFTDQRATDYNSWVNVGFAIYNELDRDGYELFMDFSKKSAGFDFNSCVNKYNGFSEKPEDKKQLKLGSLHQWAQTDNKDLYDELFKEKVMSVIVNDEEQAAVYLFKQLKDKIVCCDKVIYYKIDNLWTDDKDTIQTELGLYIRSSNICKRKNKKNISYYNVSPTLSIEKT